jgi:hypothetical protein
VVKKMSSEYVNAKASVGKECPWKPFTYTFTHCDELRALDTSAIELYAANAAVQPYQA